MYSEDQNRFLGDGKLKYDYQLWIDSDIVFDTNKFWQLMDLAIPEEGEEKELLRAGTQPKTGIPHPLHTG